MMKLIFAIGVARFIVELAAAIEDNFRRGELFDNTARVASHGVIELMPASDREVYGFKYVNGHPKNTYDAVQTVTAFGVLADVASGYPLLLTEMTIPTALRAAATSAMALWPMFQAIAFKALLGIDRLRLDDIDRTASVKCVRDLAGCRFDIQMCASSEEAVEG
ncbi:MAG: ornithine cyclodeaminase [Rhodospirillales bacterium]|nr:ornithine cyclodeaminase [Rhodospirillales bacterium]